MATIAARPYAAAHDPAAIVALINACAAVDGSDHITPNELRNMFDDPWLDVANDVRLWHAADGALIAYAHIFLPETPHAIDGRLDLYVHPAARNLGLERVIIAWAEDRLRAYGAVQQRPAALRTHTNKDHTRLMALYEQHGFALERYYLEMARSLDQVPDPQFPAGFTLRQVDGERDAEAWVALKNTTWRDHFNYRAWSVERFKSWLADPDERPELNLVALAPDGTFAAFCWSIIRHEENVQTGRKQGSVDLLGTHPAYRKLGLGRAMLLAGLQRLKVAGMDTARLDVDAASPTGATRLYAAAGFAPTRAFVGYTKHIT